MISMCAGDALELWRRARTLPWAADRQPLAVMGSRVRCCDTDPRRGGCGAASGGCRPVPWSTEPGSAAEDDVGGIPDDREGDFFAGSTSPGIPGSEIPSQEMVFRERKIEDCDRASQ